MADRIGVISQGNLVQIGSPRHIYTDPDDEYVASRLGSPSINLIPVSIFRNVSAPDGTATLGVRTEHLKLLPANQTDTTATVKRVEHLGDQSHLHLSIDKHEIVILVDPDGAFAAGERIGVQLENPLYFTNDGERIRI